MLGAHTLDYVSRKAAATRPRYSREIAARRTQLGKSGTDIDDETQSVIYPKLLSRLETGIKDPTSLTVMQLDALLESLQWTPREFYEATGVEVPGSRSLRFDFDPTQYSTVTHIPSSLKTLPTYRLVVPRNGKGERVRIEDGLLPLEEGLTGDFEIYQLEEEGVEPTTYLVRKQDYARKGHIVICDVPERGTLAAKVKSVQDKLYILETSFETFATEKIMIRGVAVYKYERLEEPPNGVN